MARKYCAYTGGKDVPDGPFMKKIVGGKKLGCYKTNAAAYGALTRHRKTHPHIRGLHIEWEEVPVRR